MSKITGIFVAKESEIITVIWFVIVLFSGKIHCPLCIKVYLYNRL